MAKKCLIMICRSSSVKIYNREWIMPLNDKSELPGKFYREKIPLASIIVSRTWKLRFTSKRISWLNENQRICHFRYILVFEVSLYGDGHYTTFCIRITCPCVLYHLSLHLYRVKLGFTGVFILSYFCSKT